MCQPIPRPHRMALRSGRRPVRRAGRARRRAGHAARGARSRPDARSCGRPGCWPRTRTAITAAHREYFEAGAQVAITASYQASFEGFAQLGLDRAQAAELLRRSVRLARRRPHGRPAAVAAGAAVGGGFRRSLRRRARRRLGVPRRLRAVGRASCGRGTGRGWRSWPMPAPMCWRWRRSRAWPRRRRCSRSCRDLGVPAWLSMTCADGRTRAGEPRRGGLRDGRRRRRSHRGRGQLRRLGRGQRSGDRRRRDHPASRRWSTRTAARAGTRRRAPGRARDLRPGACRGLGGAGARLVGGCCRVGPSAIRRWRGPRRAGRSGELRAVRWYRRAGERPAARARSTASTSQITRPRSTSPNGTARYHGVCR